MASDPGRRETLIALAAYAGLVALAAALGLRMTVPWAYYQILSPGPLANDLSASILHLHAQPPLLNTGLGLALKLAALNPGWLQVPSGRIVCSPAAVDDYT